MMVAVDLDDEAVRQQGKIDDEGADRNLPAKMGVFDRHALQVPPQATLGIRHVATQAA